MGKHLRQNVWPNLNLHVSLWHNLKHMENKNVIIENEDLNEIEFTADIWEAVEEEDDVFDEDKFDKHILKGNVLETEFFDSEAFDDEDDDWV